MERHTCKHQICRKAIPNFLLLPCVVFYSMVSASVAVLAAKLGLFLSFTLVAGAAPCPAGTVSMEVATTAELQTMITAINCTGEGMFDVTWIGSVPLLQTIEVCGKKQLTVTGSTSTPLNLPSAAIDAGSTTGIFIVCNGSTLSLNNVLLEGGISSSGAAIDARVSSSVYLTDCGFTNNNATTGGETIHIEVYTHFTQSANNTRDAMNMYCAMGSDRY